MNTIKISVNGRSIVAFESKRPKGYRLASGIIGGDNVAYMEIMKSAVIDAGYTIIKDEYQTSTHGPVCVIFFK